MTITRRDLFRTAGVGALSYSLCAPAANAIEPIQRTGKPSMRLSLAAYSFRQWLDLKKKDMTLFDFIDMAAGWPLDAVELTAYYFEKTTPEYLAALKGRCTKLGLDISGTAVGNDFCVTDAEALKKQIASVKQWIEHTSLLGGKTIRIFAGTLKKGDNEARAIKQAVESIQEACEHAGKYGIYLALENHGGITATSEQLLSIVKAVKSDWFGVNLDSGNFHTEDPYADLAKIAPYAVIAQFKTEIKAKDKPKEEANLSKLTEMLRKVNYRGYVALEYEAAEDAKVAVPRYLAAMRKLIG
jgi:sugar phosphate isomerase/epimerase